MYNLVNNCLKVSLVFLQSVSRVQVLIAKLPLPKDSLPNEGDVLGKVMKAIDVQVALVV